MAGFAAVLLLGGALALGESFSWRLALLYGLGAGLGLVLYHATFGFASSWRRFLLEGRSAGLRAQMIMLGLATLLFFPVLAEGSLFGRSVIGAVAPVGVSVAFGAFVFGIGMQLGGACASGTLYTLGGGSSRMAITLLFFIAGAVIGSAHLPWWLGQPSLGSFSLTHEFGLAGALTLQLGVLVLLFGLFLVAERYRRGTVQSLWRLPKQETNKAASPLWRQALRGPWPLVWGALLLAVLNFATLAVAGHPWTVTFGYNLWGAKLATAAGLDLSHWTYWSRPFTQRALDESVFANVTSVMNFGILAGALLAAGLAGRFSPSRRIGLGPALAAALGGLLMGYGALLAFGCNIGALFSGIASGSLHGWLWFALALAGTWVGAKLRPVFGL